MKATSVRLDDDTIAYCRREGERLGIGASEVMRRAIQFRQGFREGLQATVALLRAGVTLDEIDDDPDRALELLTRLCSEKRDSS